MSVRTHNYEMGFMVDNLALPDPSEFSGKASDLDSGAGRDATGLLHRKRVATKHPIKLKYNHITWGTMNQIMGTMRGKESFQFTFPDPLEGTITVKAYCGDRDWDAEMAPSNDDYVGNLEFSVIEF